MFINAVLCCQNETVSCFADVTLANLCRGRLSRVVGNVNYRLWDNVSTLTSFATLLQLFFNFSAL